MVILASAGDKRVAGYRCELLSTLVLHPTPWAMAGEVLHHVR